MADEEEDIILAELDDEELTLQMHDDLYDGLREEIEEGVNILLGRGWQPYDVLTKALVEGMRIVGIDFRDGILFVPEVLLAANAMKAGMELLRPLLDGGEDPVRSGRALAGLHRSSVLDTCEKSVKTRAELRGIGMGLPDDDALPRNERSRRALTSPIFLRPTGMIVTPAGERLLPFAKAAERLLSDAMRAVADDGVPRGDLILGSLETTAAMHLSPVLTGFAGDHPGVDLSIRTGTTAELIEDVLENRVEGAFVCGPVDHPDLDDLFGPFEDGQYPLHFQLN